MSTIAPNLYPLLISVIDESYTDGLDRISSARLNDDDTVLVVGMDGAKQIGVKISDSNIKIRLLNSDPIDTNSAAFSDSNIYQQLGMRLVELALEVEFAAPKAKNNGSLKKKTCKAGLSCGGTCISKSKVCARALSIEQQKQFKELKKRLKAGDSDAQTGIDNLRNEQQGIKKESVGGELTTTPTKPEPKRQLSEREQIDNKYASRSVSDEDANAWFKERAKIDSNPAEAESIAIAMALRPPGYSKVVNDRDSYLEMLKTIDPSVSQQEAEDLLKIKTDFWRKRVEAYAVTDAAEAGKKKPSKAKKLADIERIDIVRRRIGANLPSVDSDKIMQISPQEFAKDYLQKTATGTATAQQRFGLADDASISDIKKRYRELAAKNHPDVGGNAEKFMQIKADYEQLLSKQSGKTSAFSYGIIPLIDLLSQLNLEIENA
jgi:hypothetical protein